MAWADRHADGLARPFCLEATGPYAEAPADARADAGRRGRGANPARVKAHAAASGQGNQTDPADARAVAPFARARGPPAGPPPPPEVRQLQGLVRRVDDLVARAARAKGRLASPALTQPARRSVQRTLRLREREAAKVRAEVDALGVASPPRRADRALRESITGVGRPTAPTVRAEWPAVERLPSAESAAASGGLAPREFRSGTSVPRRTRLAQAGTARRRKAL